MEIMLEEVVCFCQGFTHWSNQDQVCLGHTHYLL